MTKGADTHKDGKEQLKRKASGAHTDISIVGTEEDRDEDHHIEARQRPDALWRSAALVTFKKPGIFH